MECIIFWYKHFNGKLNRNMHCNALFIYYPQTTWWYIDGGNLWGKYIPPLKIVQIIQNKPRRLNKKVSSISNIMYNVESTEVQLSNKKEWPFSSYLYLDYTVTYFFITFGILLCAIPTVWTDLQCSSYKEIHFNVIFLYTDSNGTISISIILQGVKFLLG